MLRISEFSRLSHVTVKALRYYDEIGLLPPATVDAFTNYRYYSAEQLPRLRRIIMLKEMGFQLVEIGRILNDNLDADQIASIAQLKRADLQAQLAKQQAQLEQLDYWLDQLKQEQKMSDYTIAIKEVAAVNTAYARVIVPTQKELPHYLGEIGTRVALHARRYNAHQGTAIAEYYDEEFTGIDIDVAQAVVLTKEIPAGDRVEIRKLAGGIVAYTTHVGPYRFLTNAYDATLRWIQSNGYRVCGTARDVYLAGNPVGNQEDCVTEVQFFVAKEEQENG